MGNGMNKIITGVYVGNFRDAKDPVQLEENKITHILSIHDNAKALHKDRKYLCIIASDTPDQPLTHYFPQCIEFIHKARLENGRVLIHCLAGISRSVTVTAAYIMTVTHHGWRDSVNAIRGARNCANPNFGFQKQLQDFENEGLENARKQFKKKYPNNQFSDDKECDALIKCYRNFLTSGETLNTELYSLPHKAYSERSKPNPKPNTAETSKAHSERSKPNPKPDTAETSKAHSERSKPNPKPDTAETSKAHSERSKPNPKPDTAETSGEIEFGNKEVHNDTSVSGANTCTDKGVSGSTRDTNVSGADEQSASTGKLTNSDSEQTHSDNKL